ncbi:MAG TPA: peptide chain release factor 1 [Oligoflexia bacterium]|nr:peptide chain release factor 1 [Oligoflexia bacterium]HMP47033.1 peptide chain release factor 1 [Oligoflexia bacterium]
MLQKLQSVVSRFEELTSKLSDPALSGDRDMFRQLSKEHSDLEPIVTVYKQWERLTSNLNQSKEILEESSDSELRELASIEINELEGQIESLRQELLILLLPKDPNDEKNIILEIRAGTGGDEASLFAENLFSMYVRFAEKKGWRIEILSASSGTVGGFKEVIASIVGLGAYSLFKYESGVHRVQRVPQTETQGRIHTSTVTVAVLPEAEEVDIAINDKDLRIDVYRSSGPGGQSVNTTDSAVRVTHIPTGMVVTCQDEKSQHKNKAKALTVLRARLFDMEQAKLDSERSQDRKSQIGTGERSEKIRTYNYAQSRVTDHRIGLTIYQLDSILGGELQLVLEPLIAHFRAEALKGQGDDVW